MDVVTVEVDVELAARKVRAPAVLKVLTEAGGEGHAPTPDAENRERLWRLRGDAVGKLEQRGPELVTSENPLHRLDGPRESYARAWQPVKKVTRHSAGDASRLNRPPTGRTGATRPSTLRFGRNTPGPVLPVGAPPSRVLSGGRLARLGAHVTFSTG